MLLQGYMTSDIQAFSASGPPIVVSYAPDSSGPTLLLNVTIAYPGSAPQSSQVRILLSVPFQVLYNQACNESS